MSRDRYAVLYARDHGISYQAALQKVRANRVLAQKLREEQDAKDLDRPLGDDEEEEQ
jgi:hypothetical protein